LGRLIGQEPIDAGPIALCGRVDVIDATARLLLGRGDRRALAPLTRPLMRELRRCSVIVACDLAPDDARSVAAAHRPWIALVAPDCDRYAYGCLPRLGAQNVLHLAGDGAVPEALRDRLVAVLDPRVAAGLALRLPPLRGALRRRLERRGLLDAGLAGFGAARTSTLLEAVAAPILCEARAHGASRNELYTAAATAATATAAAQRLTASSPRLARAAGAAACTWAAHRVATLLPGRRQAAGIL
jgi:hypothetical protein